MDLSKRDNTLQTLRYLLDGGLDARFNETSSLFSNIVYDAKLHKLLDGWYIGASSQFYLQADIKENNFGI